MSKLLPYVLTFSLIAVIYHLSDWRPDEATGEGFDSIVDVTLADWDQQVIHERKPVLVFFNTPGSAACAALEPIIADTQKALQGQIKVARINLSGNASLAMRYRIAGSPALLLFKNGLLTETLNPAQIQDFMDLESKLAVHCDDA